MHECMHERMRMYEVHVKQTLFFKRRNRLSWRTFSIQESKALVIVWFFQRVRPVLMIFLAFLLR